MSTLTIRRRSAFRDRWRRYWLELDGTKVATIAPKSTLSIDISPGYHRLRITIDWCSSNTLEFQAQPGCDLSLDVSPDPTVPLFWALTFGRRSWLQLTPAGLGT